MTPARTLLSPSLLIVLIFQAITLAASSEPAFSLAGQSPEKAQAFAEQGRRLIQSGDLKGAEADLRQAVQLAPRNATYLGTLGAILGMEKRLEESDRYLEQALALDPGDPTTRRNLASNQFQLGQLHPAALNLQRVLQEAPKDRTAILLLGMVDEEMKNYKTAVRLLASVPDQVEQRPESIAALACSYYHLGQRDKARSMLSTLQLQSAGPEGVFRAGQVAAQAQDYTTAEKVFASIPASYPDRAKLGYNLALAYYHAGELHEARATLQKVLDGGYDTSDIENLMGWCLYRQGDKKAAVRAMDRAVDLDPSRENNYLDVGMMLLDLRRWEGAKLAAEKAIQAAPKSYQAYRLLGQADAKLGELKTAEKDYARAAELNPSDRESILGLVSAEADDGRVGEAEATFDRALRLFPHDGYMYQQYARLLLAYRGRDPRATESRALELLHKAIELDDSLAGAHAMLGDLALGKGKAQEASQQLELAARLDPEESQVHYSLAQAYRQLGRRQDAARELQTFRNLKAKEAERPPLYPGSGKPAEARER